MHLKVNRVHNKGKSYEYVRLVQSVTVHTKTPTAVALFAGGLLQPVGGASVELMVAGNKLSHMVLAEVRCSENFGYHDVAVLVFKPATAELPL